MFSEEELAYFVKASGAHSPVVTALELVRRPESAQALPLHLVAKAAQVFVCCAPRWLAKFPHL